MNYLWRIAAVFTITAPCCTVTTQIDAPSRSAEGVEVGIAQVKCNTFSDSDGGGHNLEVGLLVKVANRSLRSLQVYPHRMRLSDQRRGLASQLSSPRTTVNPGESRTVVLRFEDDSGIPQCSDRMTLDPADSLVPGEPSIVVTPVGFAARD
jgi:hypothetical protein